ncbi:MAG: hypothetical protein ACE14L_11005 [Terriglobales bacterium]
MKNLIGTVVVALLVFGVVSGTTTPTNPGDVLILAEGSGPTPLCSPWDYTCDPGPMLPKPRPPQLAEGSGPTPLCSPWDCSCDPGPTLPKPCPKPQDPSGREPDSLRVLAEGSGPTPLCSPWDYTCDPGPMLPRPRPPAATSR